MSPGGGWGTDRDIFVDHSLWDIPFPFYLLQVYWEISLVGGQWMSIFVQQPSESMAKVGVADKNVEQEGCRWPDLGPDSLGGGSVAHALRVGDVVHENLYWECLGCIPPQGGPQSDGEATLEMMGRSTGLSLDGLFNIRGGIAGGEELRLPPTEHSCTVYCNQAQYGLLPGGGEEAGVKGGQALVIAGRTVCWGNAVGGLVGRTDGERGEDRRD